MRAAVRFPQSDGYLGHGCLAVSEHQFCAVGDDTAILLHASRQESRYVHQGQDRNVETVAETHETGCLAGCLDIQHAGVETRLVGDDTDGASSHAGKADNDVAGIQFMYFQELPVIDNCLDDFHHVVRQIRVVRNQAVQFVLQAVNRVVAYNHRSLFQVVVRQVGQQLADGGNAFLFILSQEMRNAGFRGMHGGTAEVFR